MHAIDDEDPTRPQATLPRARILLVEDDARFRGMLTSRLDRDGFDVYTAATGEEAITMLGFVGHIGWPTDELELVILDAHLPGRSGVDILRKLRAENDNTPALLMTAFPDAQLIADARRYHAGLLLKPFSLDLLCDATIAAICAGKEGAREHADHRG